MIKGGLMLGACLAATPVMIACKVQHQDVAPEPSGSSVKRAPTDGTDRLRMQAAPETGEVAILVRDAMQKAAIERRRLVVYVGATWCEPCRRVHEAAQHGELDAAFGHLDLLEFDLDRDRERLRAAGYEPQYIPLFALPSTEGTASGKQLEGAIKGEGAVAFIRPRLAQLLAQ